MKKSFKHVLVSVLTFCVMMAAVLFPHGAHAGGSWGGTAAEFTQLANNVSLVSIYVKDVEQLAMQTEQIHIALQRYENLMATTKQLTDFQWIDASGFIVDLQRIVTRVESLYDSIGQFDEVFRKQYRGYRSNVAQYATLSDYTAAESKQYLNGLEQSVGQYNMTLSDFETTGKTLETLQKRSSTAEGRMQALQGAIALSARTAQEMSKLRIAVAAQSDMMATAEAFRVHKALAREAADRQTRQNVFAPYHVEKKEDRAAYLDFLGPDDDLNE